MREILFRAWDRNNNKMLYVGDNQWTETIGKMLDSFEDEDLMQWTGLVDCNGNKIFKGDYLQGNKGESDKWSVIFNDNLAKFEAKFVGRKDSCIENKELYFVDRAFVCGNCFQNPELINNTNQ